MEKFGASFQKAKAPKDKGGNMSIIQTQQKAVEALNALVLQSHIDGFEAGLQIANQIVSWLEHLPDNEFQADIRKWADTLICKARRDIADEELP